MKHMIRYKLKADRVEENERLVAAVYEELARVKPAGLRYATLKLEDGVSFVHLVSHEIEGAPNALTALASFKDFTAGIKERCVEMPARSDLTALGAYRFFGE